MFSTEIPTYVRCGSKLGSRRRLEARPFVPREQTSSAPWSGGALISGALIGGWEIGVTMDETPFAVDSAIDVASRGLSSRGAFAIEQRRVSTGIVLECRARTNLHARAREHEAVTGTGT